jgi:hypothetical protein
MKHFLYYVCILLILLPGIQKKFTPVKEAPLKGAFTLEKADHLTRKNWFSGRFQQSYAAAFNDTIGFRKTLIRLYNQVNFSLFNLSSVDYIVIGKAGYLYTENYINAYTGKDKLKKSALRKKLNYIHQLQEYLEKKGIHFILVFEPSKARILPEFIPSRYVLKNKGLTNYEEYIHIIRQEYPDLHVFDVNEYFRQLKKRIVYPLYAKEGIHWTLYAAKKYFMDTLVRYMGNQQRKSFPPLAEKNFHWSDKLQWPDNDMMQLLNLPFSRDTFKLPYADFSFGNVNNDKKPSLLVVSDSYYSILHGSDAFNSLFSKNDYWFYNKTRFPEAYYKGNTDPVFLRDDILHHDFVILMATEINISDFFLFPENALSWFGLGDSAGDDRVARIQHYIDAIYKNPEWLNNIKGQMKKANKSLEELIRDNAEYMERKEHEAKTGKGS